MRLPFATTAAKRSKTNRRKVGTRSSNVTEPSGAEMPSDQPDFNIPIGGNLTDPAIPYDLGSAPIITISSGSLFAGRQEGGGLRPAIYGTATYGSGYGLGYNTSGHGVGGLGFPYVFWPVVWGPGFGYGADYLHDSEYGTPDNTSRPGGPLYQVQLQPEPSTSTYFIVADNSTVNTLIVSISKNCTGSNFASPEPFTGTNESAPLPEQAIQYYRASTIVLTLDGYNNTAALSDNATLPNVPLPAITNETFLTCVNETIGAAAPILGFITVTGSLSGSASLNYASAPSHITGLVFLASLFLAWL